MTDFYIANINNEDLIIQAQNIREKIVHWSDDYIKITQCP